MRYLDSIGNNETITEYNKAKVTLDYIQVGRISMELLFQML